MEVLPKEKDLFYVVKSIHEQGLMCVVQRSDGVLERSLHVNDVMKLKLTLAQKRKAIIAKNCRPRKRSKKSSRYSKLRNLFETEKDILDSLELVGDYRLTLFNRRRYLDDRFAHASLKLLQSKFPTVRGLQSVLLVYKPKLRVTNKPIAPSYFILSLLGTTLQPS